MSSDLRPMVFVSYSRKDSGFCEQLEDALDSTGIRWWRDVREIELGDYFRGNVTDGIRECAIFLLLVSRHSVQSREVLGEVELAHEEGKRIVPGYIEPLEEPLPSRLVFTTGLNRIEFYLDFARGVAQLLQLVGTVGADRDRAEGDLLPYSVFGAMAVEDLEQLSQRLQERIAAGRSDARVLAKAGEYLLHLGRPDEARPLLVAATKLNASSPLAPYLLALAVIRHRRPRVLTMREVEDVLRLLDRAERAEPGGYIAALGAVVKTDYYDGNGLLASAPTSTELWKQARSRGVDPFERKRIIELVGLDARLRSELELV